MADVGGKAPEADSASELPLLARLSAAGGGPQTTRGGMGWVATGRLCSQVVQLGSTALLARLLLPADYGLVAVVFAVTFLAAIFYELGLESAIVRSPRLSEELLGTAFTVSAVASVVMTVLVAGTSSLVAALYDRPELSALLALASLTFLVTQGLVHTALLERVMRFRTLAIIETSAVVISASAALTAAGAGLGAKSLVVGPVTGELCRTAMLWMTVRWRPRFRTDRDALRELWANASGVLGFRLTSYIGRNADSLLLGGRVSPSDLGYYSRAFALMIAPVSQISVVLNRVLLPSLLPHRDDVERLRAAWRRSCTVAALLMFPIGVGVSTASPALIETLYGSKWLPAGAVLQILALQAPAHAPASSLAVLYPLLGHTGRLFRIGLLQTTVGVVSIGIGSYWGIRGVAIAVVVSAYLTSSFLIVPALRFLDYRLRDLFQVLLRPAAATAVMAAASLGVRWSAPDVDAWQLLLMQATAGALAYAVAVRLLVPEAKKLVISLRRRGPG